MAAVVPSASRPRKTAPEAPRPTTLHSLNPSVARSSSRYVNTCAPRLRGSCAAENPRRPAYMHPVPVRGPWPAKENEPCMRKIEPMRRTGTANFVALTGGGVAAPGVMAAATGRRCAGLAVAVAAAAAGVRLARPRPAGHCQDDGHGDEQHEAYGQGRDWQYGEERIRPTAAADMVVSGRRRPRGERRPRRETRVREVVRGDRGWCRCRRRRRRGERVLHSGRPSRMAGSVRSHQDRAVETIQRVNRGIRKATSRRAYRYSFAARGAEGISVEVETLPIYCTVFLFPVAAVHTRGRRGTCVVMEQQLLVGKACTCLWLVQRTGTGLASMGAQHYIHWSPWRRDDTGR